MRWSTAGFTKATVLVVFLPLALAHGKDGAEASADTDMGVSPPSYFRLKEHNNIILAHIALMTISWAFVLPVAVMLSVARSRFHLAAQLVFLFSNALGLVLGATYNHQTPDLYENEKHGPIGWVSTWVAIVWVSVSLVKAYAGGTYKDRQSGQAITAAAMAMFRCFDDTPPSDRPRWSGDSGQGTELDSEPLFDQTRSPSVMSEHQAFNREQPRYERHGVENDEEDFERRGFLRRSNIGRLISRRIERFSSFKRMQQVSSVTKTVLDRMILLFGFLCVATGAVVYSGIFHGSHVFNGLAHFIKGAIFFWYGLLSFSRWMGCFADFGWAWNKKPPKEVVGRWPALMPSAEFIESAVICFYGASNVWLEHLSNPGGEWAAIDLEHVSISLMFFGGGLLSMLIESTAVRDLLMTTIQLHRDEQPGAVSARGTDKMFTEPEQWLFSVNPMPALIIFLLGLMMGGHHQASKVSTMMHGQFGQLFAGASLARISTYAITYIRPPTSYLPQRPPTEIITSFCLSAGGLMLMMSNKDTVKALEFNSLDAMFVFNVTIGFTAFLMAWVAVCLAIKGWVQRREAARAVGSQA